MTLHITDTHQHLWNLQRIDLPWVKTLPRLNRSFDQAQYEQATAMTDQSEFAYEIARTLYMEVDVPDEDIDREIAWGLEHCQQPDNRMVGMVAPCRPESGDFARSIELARANPAIRGFRRVLHTDATPPGTCLTDNFIASMKQLGERSLPFDICIRREELGNVVQLARRCPETRLVLDHCGNMDVRIGAEDKSRWEQDIREIARQENVWCKISGFVWTLQSQDWSYDRDIKPVLQVVWESFGPDRILFGGDWPVCTLSSLSFQQWLNSIYRFAAGHGPDAVEKLFSINAEKVYQLADADD